MTKDEMHNPDIGDINLADALNARIIDMDKPLIHLAATCDELQARLEPSDAKEHLRIAEQTLQNARLALKAAVQDLTKGDA